MPRVYFQKDVAADDGEQAACSGLGNSVTTADREINETSPVGSGTRTIGSKSSSIQRAMHFESASGQPGETTWPAGDTVVRFNVTTANSNLALKEIHVCQVDSTGSNKATYGSLTGMASSLGSTGVRERTISCSEITGALASDQLYIIIAIARISGHGTQEAVLTMDQEIDTPFSATISGTIACTLPALSFFATSKRTERGVLRGVARGIGRGI